MVGNLQLSSVFTCIVVRNIWAEGRNVSYWKHELCLAFFLFLLYSVLSRLKCYIVVESNMYHIRLYKNLLFMKLWCSLYLLSSKNVATEKVTNVYGYESKRVLWYTLNTIIHATTQLKYNGSCMCAYTYVCSFVCV